MDIRQEIVQRLIETDDAYLAVFKRWRAGEITHAEADAYMRTKEEREEREFLEEAAHMRRTGGAA